MDNAKEFIFHVTRIILRTDKCHDDISLEMRTNLFLSIPILLNL